MEAGASGGGNSLNPYQKGRLLVTCQHVDKLLGDIEAILTASASKSPFPKYTGDVSLPQHKVVEDYIARIRAQLVRVLAGQDLAPPGPRFGSIHSIRTVLSFVNVAIEELKPKYLRGYGEVPEAAVPELNGLVGELQGLAEKLDAYLAQGLGQDLQARLERLQQTSDEVELLKGLEQIISEHGLVEFRQAVSMILDRLEENRFEIALFGRVNCGKSSLLNYLLGTPMLPVGVNPITAVPTRIAFGPEPKLTVWFADRKPEVFPLERLAEFAAEQHNPANSKRVTRIVVEVPSPRLKSGVVFVDTPGLGSLATSGAAETMAYLPRCDLGGVLIDAGSTLTPEDLATIRVLYEAAIPCFVLLSKADLLSAEDREQAIRYIAGHVRSELGLELAVHPVSVIGEHSVLLDRWLERQLLPLCDRHQQLGRESLRRKIGALGESVEAALRVRLERASIQRGPDSRGVVRVESLLRQAAGKFEELRRLCEEVADELAPAADEALERAATAIIERGQGDSSDAQTTELVSSFLAQIASEKTRPVQLAFAKVTNVLAKTLREAADALELGDAPSPAELGSGLLEMPRLDVGELRLDLRAAFRFAFGKRLARNRVESRLRNQIGTAMSEAFYSYARLLGAWGRQAISELQARYDAHADTYRAHLAGLAGTGGVSSQDQEAIRRDLELLRQWHRGAEAPVVVEGKG